MFIAYKAFYPEVHIPVLIKSDVKEPAGYTFYQATLNGASHIDMPLHRFISNFGIFNRISADSVLSAVGCLNQNLQDF